MSKRLRKTFILLSFILFFLSFSFLLLAAEERSLEVKYPEISGFKPETVKTGLPEYVRYVFNLVVALSGFIALGALIWGGFVYLASAGKPEKLKEGKDRIISAFLGIIILLSSYIILTSINPQLVIFNLPPLTPPEIPEVPEVPPLEPGEVSLIVTEIPLGQVIDKNLWAKKNRTETKELVQDNENFLFQSILLDDREFERLSDLNKYLKSLTDQCHCELMAAFCTKPVDCARDVHCTGDPCPEEVRKKIGKVLGVNQGKIQKLVDFQKLILEKKAIFEKEMAKFQDVEQEVLSCEEQTKSLLNLSEHLSRINYFNEQGWTLKTVTIPGAPKPLGDALTFYCSVGGTIFDYPYTQKQELYPEFTEPFMGVAEQPEELSISAELNCPVEFPVGEIVDQIREQAVLLIVKLEKLAALDEKLVTKLNEIDSLVSQCSDKNCKTDCKCVPNLCPICGPALLVICNTLCYPTPWGCIPNPCFKHCSPCIQTVGGCTCKTDSQHCPCPRQELDKAVDDKDVKEKDKGGIKQLEEEIVKTAREIRGIFDRAASLLGENLEDAWNLKSVRDGMRLCYSSSIEEPIWTLMTCKSATGNYGPKGHLIDVCNPRNFFCCSLSEEKIEFPWETPSPPGAPITTIPAKKYPILPEGEKGCPQGWLCDPDVKTYNQYSDASDPLKQFISCMRSSLDKIKIEKELPETLQLGRITSISDSKLYKGTCSWENGPVQTGGCTHLYEIKYGKERVSAHYGGPTCRYLKNSFALDLGDEQNADYLIAAAKECRPDAFVIFRAPGHYDHLHISIGQAEGCGAN